MVLTNLESRSNLFKIYQSLQLMELIRYARIFSSYGDFIDRERQHTKMLGKCTLLTNWRSTFEPFTVIPITITTISYSQHNIVCVRSSHLLVCVNTYTGLDLARFILPGHLFLDSGFPKWLCCLELVLVLSVTIILGFVS